MGGGLKFKAALAAIVGVVILAFGGASAVTAADLGGDCCADLEERIAELEATTARKGNRKVKLEVSGQVNQAVMWWDDGFESNAYVVTNDNSRTRFRFKGSAKISDDWSAGYLIEIGIRTANSKRATQDNPEGNDNPDDIGLDTRHAVWYIDSKTYGRGWIGLTGGAGESVTEVNSAATKDIAKYSEQEDAGLGMFLVNTDGVYSAITWRRLIRDNGDQPGEGRRYNMVRYDTPTWHGFTATVNWGADDAWEAGLRYAGEISGFKIAAAVAYGEQDEESVSSPATVVAFQCLAQGSQITSGNADADCNQVGGSTSIMHEATGLYVNVAAGVLTDNLIDQSVRFAGTGADDESTFWAVEAGIEHKWWDIGKTTFFGQYYQNDGGANARRIIEEGDGANPFNGTALAGDARIFNTELTSYGVGVVQGIDAAAMHVYLFYRHYEADLTALSGTSGTGTLADPDLEDLDVVMGGGIIRF
jgi:predicted porin